MKQFTSIKDINSLKELLTDVKSMKKEPYAYEHVGKNKTLGLLFFNPSLRTRLSTQKAAQNLGMNVMVMNLHTDGWSLEFEDGVVMNQGSQEHITEAVHVISQYCDIIGVRTFPTLKDREKDYAEHVLNAFLKHATVPVISLESATLHPLQSLTDIMTIDENKLVERPKIALTWVPHIKPLPQAVANSFLEWVKEYSADLIVANPVGFDLPDQYTRNVEMTHDQDDALKNADFVYAKNWSSYSSYGATTNESMDWMITKEKMKLTNKGKFMHCLPARRNLVVSDDVIDDSNSLVIEQANNRTFAAQAVLLNILKNGG